MSDDLDRTIRESLDRHARAIGPRPDGHLDGVWSRLERRRDRRRRVAAVGSALVVGAGVTGLVVVGAPGDGSAPGEGAPITTLAGVAWRCTGLFGDDGTYRYYTDCTPVAELPPLTSPVPVPYTGPATAPPTTIQPWPTTTAPFVTNPLLPVATSVPLSTAVPPISSPVSAPVTAPPPTAAIEYVEHDVQAGDSLFRIADAYGVDPMDIAFANDWDDGVEHLLIPGEVIVIPLDVGFAVPVTTAPMSSLPPMTTVGGPCEDATGTVPCPGVLVVGPASTVAPPLPAPANSFRCTGVLGTDGAFEYLAACDTIGPDGAVEPGPIVAGPTVVPSTTPGTFAPPATVAPTAPPTTVTFDANGLPLHTIQPGDTPAGVAAMYGISVDELTAANDPDVMNTFLVGSTLVIPWNGATSPTEQEYVVRAGDSLSTIAAMFGVDMEVIVNYNVWSDGLSHMLMVGDTIKIPPNAIIPPPPTTGPPATTAPPVEVPPLAGITEGRARDLLVEAGLAVDVAYQQLPAGDPRDGTVLEQDVPARSGANPGDTVTIVVGRATAGA